MVVANFTQEVIKKSKTLANAVYDRWDIHGLTQERYGVLGASEDDGDITDFIPVELSNKDQAITQMVNSLNVHPVEKYNLFYTVCLFSKPERKAEFALPSKLNWFESDGNVKPEKLNQYGLKPSSYLESSPGHYHFYYERDIVTQDAKELNELLGGPFGSSHAKDMARYLRVPGTINHKSKYGPIGKPISELTNTCRVYIDSELRDGATLAATDPKNKKMITKKSKEVDPDDPLLGNEIQELSRDEFLLYSRSLAIGDSRHDLRMYNRLISDFTDKGKRSDYLYSLEHYLAKYIDYEHACVLIWNCIHNKFKERNDGVYRVRFETRKAFLEEDAYNNDIIDDTDIRLVDLKNEIFKVNPKISYIVDGFIKSHDLTLLVGLPESYKTWLAYTIIGHVTLSIPLGNLPYCKPNSNESTNGRSVKQGPCVIIESDTGSDDTNVRLQKILRGLGIHDEQGIPEGMIYRLEARLIDLSSASFRKKLTDRLKEIQALDQGEVLVIFDNLRSLSGNVDENSVKEMKPTLLYAHYLAKEDDFTTILLHHTTKDGKNYSGTGAIKSICDAMIIFETNNNDEVINASASKLIGGKDRFNCIQPMAFKIMDIPHSEGPSIKMTEVKIKNIDITNKNKNGKLDLPQEELMTNIIKFIREQDDDYQANKDDLRDDVYNKYSKMLVKTDIGSAISKLKREYDKKYKNTNEFRIITVSGGSNFAPPYRENKNEI